MSSKSNNVLKENSLSELLHEFNFFIPEIQREYVWGQNERNILSSFCDDIIEGKRSSTSEDKFQLKLAKLSSEQKYEEMAALLADRGNGEMMNIGFLYSYKPNYKMEHFPDSDIYQDTYLIDGQQRFTSLFLIMLFLSVKESKIDEFKDLLRFDYKLSTIAFDYRVRVLTHDFIIKLLGEMVSIDDFDQIENSSWFVDTYHQDVTISSVVNALKIIKDKFENVEGEFYDYILNKVRFWHFKTEKTNQGEELYITMNSRGKQLEENETVRAKLFEKLSEDKQIVWSEKWENWQDFFWKNRGSNLNADLGFNEFLNCIAGLESLKNNKKEFVFDAKDIYESQVISNLSLEVIQSYFISFQYLLEHSKDFYSKYKYCNWMSSALVEFKKILFESETNWFADYTNDNKATERRRMVYIWSILYYLNNFKIAEILNDDLYRLLRVYWLRYNNFDRSVTNLLERVEISKINGIWKQTSTEEESIKHAFYLSKFKNKDLRDFESGIWKIEDHRLNLNGYQVESINSIHLIDYENLTSPTELAEIYDKFISLFPVDEQESNYGTSINDILMFYGFYGQKVRPPYYYNFNFGNWRRVVRDLDSPKNSFFNFFKDFDGSNLDTLLLKRKREFLKVSKKQIATADKVIGCNSFEDTIKYYMLLCPNLWKHGRYIAYEEWLTPSKYLTTFERMNSREVPNRTISNTRKNFRGYGHIALNDLLPSKPIEKLKNLKL